mgnify:CR=1 FL=1
MISAVFEIVYHEAWQLPIFVIVTCLRFGSDSPYESADECDRQCY